MVRTRRCPHRRIPLPAFFLCRKEGGDERTNVISGRRCSESYRKSGPLGSLVRTLLESPQWSKEGFSLKWDVKRLCSERTIIFTDTNCDSPSPSNASAKTSKPSDTKSSRFLFRLRLVGLPIDETGSFFSPILPTPLAIDIRHKKRVEELQESGVKDMYSRVNGGNRPNGLMDYLQFKGMLPTPRSCTAMAAVLNTKGNLEGTRFPNLETVVGRKLLPTPTAIEGTKYTNTFNPNSQMGSSLSAMAGSGMLPTPTARDFKNPSPPEGDRIRRKREQGYTIELNDLALMGMLPTPRSNNMTDLNLANPRIADRGNGRLEGVIAAELQEGFLPTPCDRFSPKTNGDTTKMETGFRLSPLFTQEMMGFPLGWTELPFLPQCNPGITETPTRSASISDDGETKP